MSSKDWQQVVPRNFKGGIPLPLFEAVDVSAAMQNLHHDYEGLIFDLDGTLADTMPTHFLAWSRSMAAHGLIFPEERFYALGGVPANRIIRMLAEEQGVEVDADGIAEAKERLYLDLIGDVRPVIPVQAIAEFHREHMPMAVATGSPKWAAEKILKALGIRHWFGAVVGAACVEQPKPAPDVYLRAAELIGVDPKRCHAFEDTVLGMEAARNAGMRVLDINTLLD
ncbi:MAG: HAD family hydrolase [Opitutales bacterium]